MSLCFRSLSRGPDSNFGGPFSYLLRFTTTLTPYNTRPKTLLRERGFSLGVLIASCTANLNVHQISYWQTRTAAQTRCARNNHTNLNPRYKNSPPAGAPVNKTQPKAPLPQEGFGMNTSRHYSDLFSRPQHRCTERDRCFASARVISCLRQSASQRRVRTFRISAK